MTDPSDVPTPRLTATFALWRTLAEQIADRMRGLAAMLSRDPMRFDADGAARARKLAELATCYAATFARWERTDSPGIEKKQSERQQIELLKQLADELGREYGT